MKTKHYIFFGLILFSNYVFSQVKQSEILLKDAQGFPTFIKFKETKIKFSNTSVKDFLKKQYQLNENINFKIKKNSLVIEKETKSQKIEQYYKNLKIEFNEIVIVSKNGVIKTINGRAHNLENLNITPRLSENQALNYLLKKVNAKKYA